MHKLSYCLVFVAVLVTACATVSSVPTAGGIPPVATGNSVQRAVIALSTRQFVPFRAMVTSMAQAHVVTVGEEHYQPAILAVVLHLLEQLAEQRPGRVALAMEFLERDMQAAVDAYLTGSIDDATFLSRIQASEQFISLYFPLIQYARQHRLPIVAMNTPRRIATQVARQGLQSTLPGLTPEERAYLPARFAEILPDYRTYFLAAVAQAHPPQDAQQAERLVEAAHLKDDTMAEALAMFVDQHADYTVLALAGRFHTDYGKALPRLVQQRRPGVRLVRLTTMTVESGSSLPLQKFADENLADYVWFAPPSLEERQAG